MLPVLIIPMLISFCGFPNQVLAQKDKTLEENAVGEEVVDAVVNKIGSDLFGPDHMFLKRLAYVESEFGNKLSPQSFTGGIWRVSEEEYEITKRYRSLRVGCYKAISLDKNLKIKWVEETKYSDLKKPLYSALAVHLLLCHPSKQAGNKTLCQCRNAFPQLRNAQAEYWQKNVGQNRPTIPPKENFASAIEVWEQSNMACKAKMDLVVVLDGSGSIGDDNFKRAKESVAKLFSAFSTETTRLGLVVYGSEVEFVLDFSHGKSAKELNDTVLGIEYPDSETYTNQGILAALRVFGIGEHRSGTAKIMAVFTDGKSDDGVLAVNRVIQQKITTYAVGVGWLTSQSELLLIAGEDSSHVFNVEDYTALYESLAAIVSDICRQPVRPEVNERVDDALAENEKRLYKLTAERGSRSNNVVFQHEGEARTTAYFSYSQGVSPVYNQGQLQVGINVIPLPRKRGSKRRSSATRRNDEDPDDDEYYLTESEEGDDDDHSKTEESEEEEQSVYVVVVGVEPVQSNYSIMVINDTDSISDLNITVYVHTSTTTTATTITPTEAIAARPTTSKPNSEINSGTGSDYGAFFSLEISSIMSAVLSSLIIIIA